MPWCETCERFFSPNSLNPDGTCKTCGRRVAEPDEVAELAESKAPWHFKLLVAAAVIYLGWRLVQGIDWVIQHV